MSLTEFFYGVIFKLPNGQFPLKKRFFGYIYTKIELFLVFIIKKIICYFYLIKEREENKKIFFFSQFIENQNYVLSETHLTNEYAIRKAFLMIFIWLKYEGK